jgi:hypothetical protein
MIYSSKLLAGAIYLKNKNKLQPTHISYFHPRELHVRRGVKIQINYPSFSISLSFWLNWSEYNNLIQRIEDLQL